MNQLALSMALKLPRKMFPLQNIRNTYIENNKDWLEWKFSVKVKVSEEIEEQSKDQDYLAKFRRFSKSKKPKKSKTVEKSRIIDAEINLIHAAVIKQDIAKVKAIVKMAKEEKIRHKTTFDIKNRMHRL